MKEKKGLRTVRIPSPSLRAASHRWGLVGNWKIFIRNWLCLESRARPRISSTTSKTLRNLVVWLRISVMPWWIIRFACRIPCFPHAQVSCRHHCNRTSTTGVSYSLLVSSYHLSPSSSAADQRIGISGPCPSGLDVSCPRCWVLVWEGAGVPKRNMKGWPMEN